MDEILGGRTKAELMKALVLHGFTGSLDTVSILRGPLEEAGVPVKFPVLRGHGSDLQHLYRVGWRDWASDARKAMLELDPTDREPVVMVGLSMGALVAAQMAAEFSHRVKRLALLAPAFGFRSRLIHLLPVIKRVTSRWAADPNYADPALMEHNTNYPEFPVEAFESLLDYIPIVEAMLPQIQCPVGLFFAKKDPAIAPSVPKRLEKLLQPGLVTHFTYKRSHHEMLQDVEAAQVANDVVGFLLDKKLGKKS